MEGQFREFINFARNQVAFQPAGVAQSVQDGQLHVGTAQLGYDRSVNKFDQGMNDRLGVNHHFDPV